jgi:serine/threonine-protein kinase
MSDQRVRNASDPYAPGTVLAGRFRVERKLGEGGMGVVLECTHLVLANRVVVKVLKGSLGLDAEGRARFLREGRAAAALDSAHVVRVLDAGSLESGEPFLCMEKLRGHDLAVELSRGGPLAIATAIEYVAQAARALQLAHDAGIVHRDIKPANLFLCETPGTLLRSIKVLDFGIAKARAFGDSDGFATTALGSVLGTPYYMSPEQLRSTRGVAAASDIWSLGIVLFELVTGTLPFRGETLASLTAAILTEPVKLEPIERLGDARLTRVVKRALEKDTGNRYHSMNELLDDLERHVSNAPMVFADTAQALTPGYSQQAVVAAAAAAAAETAAPARVETRRAKLVGLSAIALSMLLGVGFFGQKALSSARVGPATEREESANDVLSSDTQAAPSATVASATLAPVALKLEDLEPAPEPSVNAHRNRGAGPRAAGDPRADAALPAPTPPTAAQEETQAPVAAEKTVIAEKPAVEAKPPKSTKLKDREAAATRD